MRTRWFVSGLVALLTSGLLASINNGSIQIWPFSSERRVDLVEFTWYAAAPQSADEFAEQFVWALIDVFPACAPRRYGGYEPLPKRVRGGNLDGFSSSVSEAISNNDNLYFKAGHEQCLEGDIRVFAATTARQAYVALTISADREWVEGIEAIAGFAKFSASIGSFYASGTVSQRYIADRHGIWGDDDTEWYPWSTCRGWCGVPAIPSWLHWVGEPYLEAIDPNSNFEAHTTTHGTVFAASDGPATFGEVKDKAIPIHPDYLTKISRTLTTANPDGWAPGHVGKVHLPPTDAPADIIPTLAGD